MEKRSGFMWQWLLENEGIHMSWIQCLSIYFVGLFFNNFLVGGVGGDLFRIFEVRRISKQGASAVSAVFLDRLIGLLAMSGIAVVSIPFAFSNREFGSLLWIAFAVLIAGWCFALFFFLHRPFSRFFSRLIQMWIPRKIETKAREIYGKIYGFGKNRPFMIRILGLSGGGTGHPWRVTSPIPRRLRRL